MPVQFWNALFGITVISSAMATEERPVQPLNAPAGSSRGTFSAPSSPVQPENMLEPSTASEFRTVSTVPMERPVQLLNALSPIDSTLSASTRSISYAKPLNAPLRMLVTPSAIVRVISPPAEYHGPLPLPLISPLPVTVTSLIAVSSLNGPR